MMNVAILSDQSLLTQGILTRLNNSASLFHVESIEIGNPDAVERLFSSQPDVVILESKELSNSSIFPINRLFSVLPHLVLIEVNIETSDIQVIRSSQYTPSGITDMLNMLQNVNSLPGVYPSM